MDNDANVGALGEGVHGGGGPLSPVLHDAIDRNRRRHSAEWIDRSRRGSWAGELGHINIVPGRSGLPLRLARLSGANVLRPLAGSRLRPSR